MDVSWLTTSFEEHTISWLTLATLIGSVLGSTITLIFDEVIRPQLAMRREISRVYKKYRNPLLGSAVSLERQINTIVRSAGDSGLISRYYRMSTFYKFGVFFFWVRLIELEVGYLDMGSSQDTKTFTSLLYAPFKGLCSIRSYFKELPFAEESAVPRDVTRAIGEEMFDHEQKLIKELGPIGFSTFVKRYAGDEQFRTWFESFDLMLAGLSKIPKDIQLERLIVTAVHLVRLAKFLDPKDTYTDHQFANLQFIHRQDLLDALAKEGVETNWRSGELPNNPEHSMST